ncbi:hypothetical protein ACFE04_000386 [Oxalis oulophora]
MAASILSSCNSCIIQAQNLPYSSRPFLGVPIQPSAKSLPCYNIKRSAFHRLSVFAATEGSAKSSKSDETVPSWAKPDSDEPPPWAREDGKGSTSQEKADFPFGFYLIASAVTAIAAVGSIFEYANQKPVFGVVNPDSLFYTPLLGFFVFTGIPVSGFLWFKSVQVANKEAEEQDKRDGFL